MIRICSKTLSAAQFVRAFPDLLEDYQFIAGRVIEKGIGGLLSDDDLRELSIAKRIIDNQSRMALRQTGFQSLPEDHPATPALMQAFGALLRHDWTRAQVMFTTAIALSDGLTDKAAADDPDVLVWDIDARDLAERQQARREAARQTPRAA